MLGQGHVQCFGSLRSPLTLEHQRQAVDDHVQKTADTQAQDAQAPRRQEQGQQIVKSHARSDHLAEFEDGQVHGDHNATDDRAQDHDDEGLHQAGQGFDGFIHLFFVEVSGLAQHGVQRT